MQPFPQVRARPTDCEVGDWITADAVPEWGYVSTHLFESPSGAEHLRPIWKFELGSYDDDGDLVIAYRRIS